MGVWVLGGALTLAGALTYAELGGMFPEAGGIYVYLKEAYGPFWGFLFGSVFWAILVPWWSFPGRHLTATTSLHGHLHAWHMPVWLLALWMIVLGTIAPFFLIVSALRHLPATRVGIVAMLEPVVGALVGWAWLSESLGGVQLVGAAVVLAAIGLAQTAR